MTRQCQCPQCGCLHQLPGPAEDDSAAVIESLRQEIRHLRETVAYLRGSAAAWPGTLVSRKSL
jgi:hypothetical protein